MDKTRYRLQYLLVCCSFGIVSIFVRNIVLPTFALLFGRSLIAVIFLLIFMKIKGIRPSGDELRQNSSLLLISSLGMAVSIFCLFESYKYTTVAVATVLYYVAPIMLIVLAALVTKEKLTARSAISIAVALFGMILVSGVTGGSNNAISLKGILIPLIGAFAYAVCMLAGRMFRPMDRYVKTCTQLAINMVIVFLISLARGELGSFASLDAKSVVNLLLMGIVFTGFSYVLFMESLEKIPSSSAAILSYADPCIAVFISAVFFREPLTVASICGAILIIGASIYSEMDPAKR